MTNKSRQNRPGSFWIPRQAAELLMQPPSSWTSNDMATATQICIYLVLASHTDETGQFSTVGIKKIADATGAGKGYKGRPGQSQKAIDALCDTGKGDSKPRRKKTDPPSLGEGYDPAKLNKLVYRADDYTRMTGVEMPEIPGLHEVRYVVNTFGADRHGDGIWFAREIVEGTGHFKKPLKRLIGCGGVAARLLLKLHELQTLTYADFGGVQPYLACYKAYGDTEDNIKNEHGFSFWAMSEGCQTAKTDFIQAVIGKSLPRDKDEERDTIKHFWNALSSLVSTGLVDEVLTVFNAPAGDNEEAQPQYEITVKNRHGHISKEDQPFLFMNRLDRIFEHMNINVIHDSAGRHVRYPVISRVGVQPHLIGVFRCRFRPRNYKQFSVVEARDRRKDLWQEWDEELKLLEKSLGVNSETKKPKPAIKSGDTDMQSVAGDEDLSEMFNKLMDETV